jgi:hypothetical protein
MTPIIVVAINRPMLVAGENENSQPQYFCIQMTLKSLLMPYEDRVMRAGVNNIKRSLAMTLHDYK